MQRLALAILAAFAVLILWLWGFGGADVVRMWATNTQRDVQNAMAGALRALKSGQPGALAALWGLCFAYGFVHAAGPGHGKLVIGGYGLGARVPAMRLTLLAIGSSLAQAASAVLLVYVAIWLLGWGRTQMTSLADQMMAPLSYALIAGVGLWLLARGARKAWRLWPRFSASDDKYAPCSDCGHAHGPTAAQAAEVKSLRDAAAVIAAIAVRPCTGALFLLILTHALGLDWAGILGAFVMGLGTAMFTAIVALAAVSLRESALAQAASGRSIVHLLIAVEVLAGGVIAVFATTLMLRVL